MASAVHSFPKNIHYFLFLYTESLNGIKAQDVQAKSHLTRQQIRGPSIRFFEPLNKILYVNAKNRTLADQKITEKRPHADRPSGSHIPCLPLPSKTLGKLENIAAKTLEICYVSANVFAHSRKHWKALVGNNVSPKMSPSLPIVFVGPSAQEFNLAPK